jgi:hypothetical protein
MKINENKFPILGCIKNNKLTDRIFEMLENSGFDNKAKIDIKASFDFFTNKQLQINYISSTIHEKLSDTNNFVKAKSLLINSPETTGLLLLPETVFPDFTNVPEYVDTDPKDYPINAVLYSWLSSDNHDRILNKEEVWDDEGKTLIIIPIHDERITQATHQYELISHNEIYGWEYSNREGRAWYGKIHDYVMSFILFYNFTETETHIVHGKETGMSRRLKLNDEKFLNETLNNVEIIDITYFTKLIRTGEFSVSGHFRVQHFGVGNNNAKIVFIESYKKSGYTRGAKIDKE